MADLLIKAQPYLPLIEQSAKQYNIPPALLFGLIAQESQFNPVAKSPAGALGIAQFMPGTAKDYGINPLIPGQAIPAAAQYLRKGLDRYGGDERLALASYNAGFGNVDKHKGVPPFAETQKYVPAVLRYAQQYNPGYIPPASSNSGLAHKAYLGESMDPQNIMPPASTSTAPATNPVANINPLQFLPAAPPRISGGMRTLMSVLATIGSLGGMAGNIAGGITGAGPTGNAAVAHSLGLFDLLTRNQTAQQEYEQRKAMATNPNLPANLQMIGAIGGAPALTKSLLDLNDPNAGLRAEATKLDIERTKQQIASNTPEALEARRKAEYDDFVSREQERRTTQSILAKTKNDISQGKITPKETEKLSEVDDNLSNYAQLLQSLNEGASPSMIKNAVSGLPGGERAMQALDPQFANLRKQTLNVQNLYIKFITGAQLSEAESKRLMPVQPNAGDNPEIFKRVTQNNYKKFLETKMIRLVNMQKRGADVSSQMPSDELELYKQVREEMAKNPAKALKDPGVQRARQLLGIDYESRF